MAASVRRMNGFWRGMAGVLVLCMLLLTNDVLCQDDTSPTPPEDTTDNDSVAVTGEASELTTLDTVFSNTAAASEEVTAAQDSMDGLTDSPDAGSNDVDPANTAGTIVIPTVRDITVPDAVPKDQVVSVECVGVDEIPDTSVKAEVGTTGCEESKRIIEENPAIWCNTQICNIKVAQDGKTLLVSSSDDNTATLRKALYSKQMMDKLGVTKEETSSSSGSSVFVGILVSGLLAALAITLGYFKCQRRSDGKAVKLAEEAYPADQENQGNTLVSVAPLTPPPETQEKPNANGESPESKEQPPPTNGHSTAKTADTEL